MNLYSIQGRAVGEIIVQTRVKEGGYGTGADKISGQIPLQWSNFISRQKLVFLAGVTKERDLWSHALCPQIGKKFEIAGPHSLNLPVSNLEAFGLIKKIQSDNRVGSLMVDFNSGSRVRFNGVASTYSGAIHIDCAQSFRNCKKYVHKINIQRHETRSQKKIIRGQSMDSNISAWVATSFCFFLSTFSDSGGVDISYRGGKPGFVKVSNNEMSWFDYRGNSYYMSLGNLEVNKTCGLLFIDWASGNSLHVNGQAQVEWEKESDLPGLRKIRFTMKNYVIHENFLPVCGSLEFFGKSLSTSSILDHSKNRKVEK